MLLRIFHLSLFIFSLLVLPSSSERLKFKVKSPDPSKLDIDFDADFHTKFGFQAGFSNPPEEIEKLLEKSGNSGKSPSPPLTKASTDDNDIVPIVNTPLGGLWGSVYKSRAGRFYYGYGGIPYAQPVTRFERAELVQPWGDIRDARVSGPMCLQTGGPNGVQGVEDCLTLDVYHPFSERCTQEKSESESGKLPVIVHIHGGGFTGGYGGWHTPDYFLDHCVVYCNIQYRLGALGFLATEDGVIPGNIGLKDQALALKWIHEYIEYFGGDKDRVTAMGISAGGASVSYLLLAPETKGFIHGGIAMSGTALCPWAIAEKPGDTARFIAAQVNCPTESTEEMKECLVKVDGASLMAAQALYNGFPVFAPVVEPEHESAFITKHPYTMYKDGEFHHCPLLVGFVEDEGISMYAGGILLYPSLLNQLNNEWNTFAPQWLFYDKVEMTEEEKNDISSKIHQHYFGDAPISNDNRQKLVDLFSDRLFVHGAMETAELHSKFAPVYSYVTSYKSGLSIASNSLYQVPKIAHADDQFLFWPSTYGKFECGTEQYEFSKRIVEYWVNFAENGNPGEESWKPIDGVSNEKWFELNSPNKIRENYKVDSRLFWTNCGLYEKEYPTK